MCTQFSNREEGLKERKVLSVWRIRYGTLMDAGFSLSLVCHFHSRPKLAILGLCIHPLHKPHTSAQTAQPAHTAPLPIPAEFNVGAESAESALANRMGGKEKTLMA